MTTNSTNINDDGLVIFTSTTGDFSGVELTTKGDILTKTTTLYSRLGVGADGKALVCDSTQPTGLNYATVSSGSSVILLETQTAASSASIDFTSFDDATYSYYLFVYTNVTPQTDATDFRIRESVNGGVSYLTSNYRWGWYRISNGGSTLDDGSSSDSYIEGMDSLGNAAGEGLSGKLVFHSSNSPASGRSSAISFDHVFKRSNGELYRNFGGGMNTTSSTVNALRFYMSSGNIATGTFKMYGILEA